MYQLPLWVGGVSLPGLNLAAGTPVCKQCSAIVGSRSLFLGTRQNAQSGRADLKKLGNGVLNGFLACEVHKGEIEICKAPIRPVAVPLRPRAPFYNALTGSFPHPVTTAYVKQSLS